MLIPLLIDVTLGMRKISSVVYLTFSNAPFTCGFRMKLVNELDFKTLTEILQWFDVNRTPKSQRTRGGNQYFDTNPFEMLCMPNKIL